MRSWFRVVLPPPWMIGLFLAFYGLMEVFCWWLWWKFQGALNNPGRPDAVEIWVGAGAVCYGCFRVMGFHPFFRAGYSKWLAVTPWSVAKPLPVGPVQLVFQDVLVAGLLAGMVMDHGMHVLRVPLLFLMAWHLTVCATLWPTGAGRHAYFLAFGLGGVVYLWHHPAMALILAVALVAVTSLGLRDSLGRFPWTLPAGWETFRSSLTPGRTPPPQSEPTIGWPYDQLSPESTTSGIGMKDAVLVSLLAGWWAWALDSLVQNPFDQRSFAAGILLVGSVGGAMLRVGRYCANYWPPISLRGRLATFRWIIPGYDAILIVPVAMVLCGWTGLYVHLAGLLSPPVTLLVFIPLILFAGLGLGPTLERWRLTGNHRIARKSMNRANFIEH